MTQRTSIAVCREHTDLTSDEIAAIHDINAVQLTYARAVVSKHSASDPVSNGKLR